VVHGRVVEERGSEKERLGVAVGGPVEVGVVLADRDERGDDV
jgi:hypothetical protein